MDADRSVTATFAAAIELGVTVNGNGNVSGASGAINCGNGANVCSASFAANAAVTLVATPATGAVLHRLDRRLRRHRNDVHDLDEPIEECDRNVHGRGQVNDARDDGPPLTVSVTGNGTVTGGGIICGVGSPLCTARTRSANSTRDPDRHPRLGRRLHRLGRRLRRHDADLHRHLHQLEIGHRLFLRRDEHLPALVSVAGPGPGQRRRDQLRERRVDVQRQTSSPVRVVTLVAAPASGAKFSGWGGACSGTVTSCTVTLTAAKSVSATFTGGGDAGDADDQRRRSGSGLDIGRLLHRHGREQDLRPAFQGGRTRDVDGEGRGRAMFSGWSGACTGAKSPCTVTLTTARSVTATFSATAGNTTRAVLIALGAPIVKRMGAGFKVKLRINTTAGGIASVRGLRAGRTAASVSLRIGAGNATIGPFPVAKPGLYTFEIRLAGRVLRLRACLGLCGSAARAEAFVLTREAPSVTRTGDVWSVRLHVRSNQASDARIRAYRSGKLLLNRHFLGKAARITLGPFLLGPGNYTLRLNAIDAFGRVRTLTWIVSLGR